MVIMSDFMILFNITIKNELLQNLMHINYP